MAEIRPIRPWRYNDSLEIDGLTSPLFDVVSDAQLEKLYQNPFNSIHLSVPEGPDPGDRAARLLHTWKQNKTIIQDKLPGIYVYYQYFKLSGSSKQYCRKGFVAHIRTYNWEDRVILRHENTIPKSVNDRIELLRKTQLHASATHGLYTDPDFRLESYMDEAISQPIYETYDYQGVRDVFAVIQDAVVVQKFIDLLQSKTVILADGHHRYESSLIYKNERLKKDPHATGNEGYNFHLMYLTNTEAGDLQILATHRLIHGLSQFSEKEIVSGLNEYFVVQSLEDPDSAPEAIKGQRWTFGILFKKGAYKICLRQELLPSINWPFPEVVKDLDLTVLHYFIIEKVLGLPGRQQRASDSIDYDRSFSDCRAKIENGKAQMAIITNPVSIEEVKKVCLSGATMPQKSTYFYPKVICGFLFSSIQENEFQTPPYSRF